MNTFLYGIAILFTPGILARVLLGKLLFYKHDEKFYFVMHAFLLGIFSYMFLFIFQSGIHLFCDNFVVFDVQAIIINPDVRNNPSIFKIIFYATLMSLLIVSMLSFVEKNKYISRFFLKCKITSRFSEPDVWSYLLNWNEFSVNPWVTIRDKKNDLAYQGAVISFSDTYTSPELLLENVMVYNNSTSAFLYEVNVLYLNLTPGEIEIECFQPKRKATEAL